MKHPWLPVAGLSLLLTAASAWADMRAQDFVDKASAAGMAEIEAARLASLPDCDRYFGAGTANVKSWIFASLAATVIEAVCVPSRSCQAVIS